jgi:hypothetical protein
MIQWKPLSTDRVFDLDQGTYRPMRRYSRDERYDRISMPPDGFEGADFAFQAGGERAEVLRNSDLPGVHPIPFHQ